MRKCSLLEPLSIVDIIETEYSCEMHSQDYYEVMYIHYGTGIHVYNEANVPYQKGDLFLLAPGDRHYFKVDELTRFTYIKFTASYFESYKHLTNDVFHIVTPLSIMKMQWIKEEKITIEEPSQTVLRNTIENLVVYNQMKDIERSPVIFYQILSVFGMIKEELNKRNLVINHHVPNNGHIASYIHEHIYDRQDIAIKVIAKYFNISPSYFSSYFKKNFGISYQDYVDQYKLRLIKKRLEIGGIKLKEIASELSFTDTSHLSKFFKRHEGVSPTEYKLKE